MNKNFNTYAFSTDAAFAHPPRNIRFKHGPAPARLLTPIDLMRSKTARDKTGFPTYRKIIDAEFLMITQGIPNEQA